MVKKVVRKQKGGIGGFTPLRIGGRKKNPRQAKPGYDQEFTLPKGTSAAPIKQVRATPSSGDKVFGGGKSVWSGVKKKDADKYILKPAKEAQKSRTKKNIKSLRRPAMSAAVTTVAASSLNPDRSRRRSGRGSNIRYLSEASRKKGRTQSRASQRGLTKKT